MCGTFAGMLPQEEEVRCDGKQLSDTPCSHNVFVGNLEAGRYMAG